MTAVIFRFFSDFSIFRLFADRSAYTSTALIFRVSRIFLFSGYLPAATHIAASYGQIGLTYCESTSTSDYNSCKIDFSTVASKVQ